MISPGHLLISTVPITADKFISAAPSQGFDVAALRCRALIDAFEKSLAKLSGATPFGYFFTFFAPRLRWGLIDGGKRAAPGKRSRRLRWGAGLPWKTAWQNSVE